MRRPALGGAVRGRLGGTWLLLALLALAAPARAVDAGAPAGIEPALRALEVEIARVDALRGGALDPELEPGELLGVRLDDERALRLERERLRALLEAPVPATLERWEQALYAARLALDRARLSFLDLPEPERRTLLDRHAEQQAAARRARSEEAAAERRAQRAEQEREQALAAAQQARSEAERLVAEELARLLGVEGAQAELARGLEQARQTLDERREATLRWQRRARDVKAAADASLADGLYDDLRRALRAARNELSAALDVAGRVAVVPAAGEDALTALGVDVDTSAARAARARVEAEALRLREAARALERERVAELVHQVATLNHERLALLPHLSSAKREAVTGFTVAGWEQAAAEIRHVALVLRHHERVLLDWLGRVRRGDGTGVGVAFTFTLLQLALVLALFVAWRRRSAALFEGWLAKVRERDHQLRLPDASRTERLLVLASKVQRPASWLALLLVVRWILPAGARATLEVQLASVVLAWTLSGGLAISIVDALADSSDAEANGDSSRLRLRSLRLVGRVVIVLGLILALSARLVGRGTIHQWVLSSFWLVAIPVFLILVRWWRGEVFARIGAQRKTNRFEQWVVGNRSGWKSFLAAMSGAVFLFVRGALRLGRQWFGDFDLTRRALAYLFQRELEKLSADRVALEATLRPLDDAARLELGPEASSDAWIATDLDAAVDAIAREAGGGRQVIALVGERGMGKTSLLRRIAERADGRLVNAAAPGDPLAALEASYGEGASAPMRCLLLDDAQQLVRPYMGGLRELDAVMQLVRERAGASTTILAFEDLPFQYLERLRGAQPLFDRVLRLHGWREPMIAELLRRRSAQAGVAPSFELLLERLPAGADAQDREDALAQRAHGYYRLIWDYAGGNPGVALDVWRRALGRDPQGRAWVRLFPALNTSELDKLSMQALFVLRCVLQMSSAAARDVVRATALSEAEISDALRYAVARGYIEPVEQRYRVSWPWFRPVTRTLHRKHLLST